MQPRNRHARGGHPLKPADVVWHSGEPLIVPEQRTDSGGLFYELQVLHSSDKGAFGADDVAGNCSRALDAPRRAFHWARPFR
jgi:hypothetical protein